MARYRSLLSLILVIATTFLVSCSSPSVAKVPQTYTTAQIEQIQRYVPEIVALRNRMSSELQKSIQTRDWIDVGSFIHGPLGELRLEMINVSRKLLPKDQEQASKLTRDFFDNLVKLDQAAKDNQYDRATLSYREASEDLNNFLQLIPKPIIQQEA